MELIITTVITMGIYVRIFVKYNLKYKSIANARPANN